VLRLVTRLQSLLAAGSDRGQATAEYSLVLLGAAAVALAAVAWATRSGKVGELLDTVFDLVLQRAR
jgi:hypothetical protein